MTGLLPFHFILSYFFVVDIFSMFLKNPNKSLTVKSLFGTLLWVQAPLVLWQVSLVPSSLVLKKKKIASTLRTIGLFKPSERLKKDIRKRERESE